MTIIRINVINQLKIAQFINFILIKGDIIEHNTDYYDFVHLNYADLC